MSLGATVLIVILTGAIVGGLLGALRSELGAPIWLAGGLSGAIVGGLAAVLFRRRPRASTRDRCP